MKWLQQWSDVLFVHVPVAPSELARYLPRGLALDTYAERAYLGLVCFRLKLRPVGLPFLFGVSSLLELNVRTYVRCGAASGIIFLRMYADNRLAVAASRLLTPLCYELAEMTGAHSADNVLGYSCRPTSSKGFRAEFRITGPYRPAAADSLEAWLVERYTLFVDTPAGLVAAGVDHAPWQIAPARPLSLNETLCDSFATSVGEYVLHHSPGVAATFHPFQTREPYPRPAELTPVLAAERCAVR